MACRAVFRAFFILLFLASTAAPTYGASAKQLLEHFSRFQGPGEWQRCSFFEMSFGPAREDKRGRLRFEAAHGELKVTLNEVGSQESLYFVKPGVVYMSKNVPSEDRSGVEAFESLGLQGQLVLVLLEMAFPNGPVPVENQQTRSVSELTATLEINFLAGVMWFHPPWEAEVSVKPQSPSGVSFEIVFSNPDHPTAKRYISGLWANVESDVVLSDSELLDSWAVTYHGTVSYHDSGDQTFTPTLGDTDGFVTLGDIRQAAEFVNQHRQNDELNTSFN